MTTPRDETQKAPVTEPIPAGRPATPPSTIPPSSPPATAQKSAQKSVQKKTTRPTRISGTWIAVLVAIVVLIFLLVFILQNGGTTTIHLLWGEFSLPLGVALLFAAILGAVLVAVIGAARILQLRRQTKRLTGPPATSSPVRRES
ncbi:LapA family protein [Lentzea sp.]|uniref:LapA family protein n=1 Tax=Lentzea sp. TaxID=56099 RepID=UPI002B5C846E|nr:lipopolysaccharide assembly protein LapA domain-containing protein [Lentzea sp.]HUQ58867.1 lipopolysaccharide assembly protein LapA domain-containing protein [Lentzea sp.]